ncbi:transposable element p transposase [Plakobranchus ocellatus]|uniref:Transposable element p transposase n=1 Tax=Plakobranchus ocellatus TaxID=259542 RepID=A0AAV4D786_9GAST|nr:transposable element p transposase [Plakobranchus ocellatus]
MLENCGANVVAVINDNNRVNQSFFKKFIQQSPETPWIVQSPSDIQRPLFLLYDPVHLIKNIRNNWMTEKSQTLEFSVPGQEEKLLAKWSDLKDLCNSESQSLVKLSKLSTSTISPSNIEKQKVSLALNVFCEQTSSALKTSSHRSSSWSETAAFIDIVVSLWKAFNTKSIFQATRLRDPDHQVIDSTPAGERILNLLHQWAQLAQSMSPRKVRERALTRDTAEALSWTCRCLADLARYLLQMKNHTGMTMFCWVSFNKMT